MRTMKTRKSTLNMYLGGMGLVDTVVAVAFILGASAASARRTTCAMYSSQKEAGNVSGHLPAVADASTIFRHLSGFLKSWSRSVVE